MTLITSADSFAVPVFPLSIWQRVHLGVDENGEHVYVNLGERNILLGDEPGAGKSNGINLICAHGALSADCRLAPVRTPLHIGESAFVPRPDGSLLIGVTVEEGAGFDDRPTLGGASTILQRTLAFMPQIADLTFTRIWAGLRPRYA